MSSPDSLGRERTVLDFSGNKFCCYGHRVPAPLARRLMLYRFADFLKKTLGLHRLDEMSLKTRLAGSLLVLLAATDTALGMARGESAF